MKVKRKRKKRVKNSRNKRVPKANPLVLRAFIGYVTLNF
jgi:hypothetical protein